MQLTVDLSSPRSAFSVGNSALMFNPRKTVVLQVSRDQPDPAVIAEAAEILRRGGLAAFPTETVYGLGANAFDAVAVESIFAAKGRPPNNPIIVHVADVAAARRLTSHWPDRATTLAEKFWPGSLTCILPKHSSVPPIVTAGGPTVGVRVPAHPVALALLQSAEIPIAAPSANRSTQISPTTAAHVLQGLNGRIDFLLDAGPTPGGLESTVLDLTVDPPQVLRPGLVTIQQLEAEIGRIAISDRTVSCSNHQPLRSPGMLARHYAPQAKLICVDNKNQRPIPELLDPNNRIGWLRLPGSAVNFNCQTDKIQIIDMPSDPAAYAARLYAALHELDDAGVDCILADSPPTGDAWLAIHDRLRRAAQL
jgi:L-threonylcarbamoyladenylate synthase